MTSAAILTAASPLELAAVAIEKRHDDVRAGVEERSFFGCAIFFIFYLSSAENPFSREDSQHPPPAFPPIWPSALTAHSKGCAYSSVVSER